MPVSFSQIPQNIRVPLYWVEVDPSKAGLPVLRQPSLLVGTMIEPGEAEPFVPKPIGTQAQADNNFGMGSELSRMFKRFFDNSWSNEVWGVGVPAPAGSTQATGEMEITAPPREAGTIHLYIGGEYVPVVIGSSDSIESVAARIEAAINSDPNLPVTAEIDAVDFNKLELTCVWAGVTGNDIRVDLNYWGQTGGEQLPVGLGIELPATGFLTGGAGQAMYPDVIMNMGEQAFEYVCLPVTDYNTLFTWGQEFGFSDSGRWGWQRQHFGHVFAARRGTYADLVMWGMSRNEAVISTMAFETESPTPASEWAAAYTAKAQRALTNDPARPLQTLALNGVKAAPLQNRFSFAELNTLTQTGLAIQKIGADGQPMIAREQTMYQRNLYGQPDDAMDLVTTLATLARLIRNQRHAVTSKFARHKLANDGTRFGPGQAIVTPGVIKAELIAQYRQDEFDGLCEDVRNFKRNLIVERDTNDHNRINVLYPPDLVNQLRIFAVLAQFRLQYDRGVDSDILGQASGARSASSYAR